MTNAVLRLVTVAMLCGGMVAPTMAFAQDKPYAIRDTLLL
jgi:hypothetical protein